MFGLDCQTSGMHLTMATCFSSRRMSNTDASSKSADVKKGILVFKEENEKVQIRIVDLLMASAYKAENMSSKRCQEYNPAETHRHISGISLHPLRNSCPIWSKSLSCGHKGNCHPHTHTNFLFFSHERTSCRKESWVISCVSKGQYIIFFHWYLYQSFSHFSTLTSHFKNNPFPPVLFPQIPVSVYSSRGFSRSQEAAPSLP